MTWDTCPISSIGLSPGPLVRLFLLTSDEKRDSLVGDNHTQCPTEVGNNSRAAPSAAPMAAGLCSPSDLVILPYKCYSWEVGSV